MARYQCPRCATGEPHDFKHGISGYSNHRCKCEICAEANRVAARARYARNSEHIRAVAAVWEGAHPGNRAARVRRSYVKHRRQRLEDAASYRERNRDAILSRQREHGRRPEVKERTHEWYVANADAVQATKRRHRVKRDSVPVTRSRERWTAVEDKTLLREDIGCLEMAYLLQRSYASVQVRRHRLRRQLAA